MYASIYLYMYRINPNPFSVVVQVEIHGGEFVGASGEHDATQPFILYTNWFIKALTPA